MTTDEAHFAALEGVFYATPINDFFVSTIHVEYGAAKIELGVIGGFHHAGRAVHGAVLFKLLDDSAFYAACSLGKESFMVTSAFTTYFLRRGWAGKERSKAMCSGLPRPGVKRR